MASVHFYPQPIGLSVYSDDIVPFGPLTGALLSQLFNRTRNADAPNVKHLTTAADIDAEVACAVEWTSELDAAEFAEEVSSLRRLLSVWRWVAHGLLASHTFTAWYFEQDCDSV